MNRWVNKVAVVTGASAGIGAATAKSLAEKGMVVVGLARRADKMEAELRPVISKEYRNNFHTLQCDVTEEESVKETFNTIEKKFGGVNVLINNAGILKTIALLDPNNSKEMLDTVNTNIMGVIWCTREAYRSMQYRDSDAHVFLINSIAGHMVPSVRRFSSNMYSPTKFALRAMTDVYRLEFLRFNKKIKITSISPATVCTEIMGDEFIPRENLPMLKSKDVTDAINYCLQTPESVQISDIVIRPAGSKM